MSVDSTKAVIMKYLEGHDNTMIAPDAVYTMMATGQEDKGREAILQMMNYFYNIAFDATFEKANLVIGDGNAALEGFLVGTHIGEFAGMPATNKQVRVPMSIFYDVENGLVQRARIYFQMVTLMQQLGVQPAAA